MEEGGTVFFTSWSSSSHSSTTCHHILPVKSFLFSVHCLHFYRLTYSQARAFFVQYISDVGVWREISQRPSPGSWFDIWPLFLCPASAPHILLTICSQSSATSCFIIFININIIIMVVAFGCLVFFTEALSSSNSHFIFLKLCCLWNLFVNFIWELYSFSLHFFLSFPGIFSLCILLNSCSAMLKLQPFPCRGLKKKECWSSLKFPLHTCTRVRLHFLPQGSRLMTSFKILTQVKLPLKSMATETN